VLAPTFSTIFWTAKLVYASFASNLANGSAYGFGHFVRASSGGLSKKMNSLQSNSDLCSATA
jgi:hypothetical protein